MIGYCPLLRDQYESFNVRKLRRLSILCFPSFPSTMSYPVLYFLVASPNASISKPSGHQIIAAHFPHGSRSSFQAQQSGTTHATLHFPFQESDCRLYPYPVPLPSDSDPRGVSDDGHRQHTYGISWLEVLLSDTLVGADNEREWEGRGRTMLMWNWGIYWECYFSHWNWHLTV